MSINWYEVWANETYPVPYILLLRPSSNGFDIIDPKEGDRTVFESPSYEGAANYLSEDEFVRVGRNELVDE
jgi:hypothetical protein